MSDQNCKEHMPSNEEVINEITKDLENQQINEENTDSQDVLQHNACENPEVEQTDTANNCIPEDFDKSESEDESKENSTNLNDFIDEEQLKQINETLTPEEKQERKSKALELKSQGNSAHKSGNYLESIENYTEALRLCPLEDLSDRSILYCNRAASKLSLDYKKTAIEDCSKAIELNPSYVRAYLRRAKLYEETDKLDESLEDYKKVLEFDPGNPDALKATTRLPPLITERNEKLKTEMFGKLKDIGNMFLKPFGLSTDNFQLNQDPNSGGYSINFKQN
ncbi:hypothetical protein ILUMI_04435 [Ignelater luminosus]|uniref:Tetratricopeptide repeat protein 1 n=1 Tax=Ignelater luminosus TaxID=2038154 RepID=A0A8K0DDX1_IGNLU|nr:hypothetical protein ILUMI_04435 [Ignelater luminosus]